MIKISKNIQMIIFLVVLALGVFLFFYFFKQMSVTSNNFAEVKVTGRQPNRTNNESMKINLDLFSSEKFINLRSDVAPVEGYSGSGAAPARIFEAGKRNPFEPF